MPTTTAHPPGCYYANPFTKSVQRQCNPLLATGLAGLGYIGNNGTPANATNAFQSFDLANAAAMSINPTGGLGSSTGALPSIPNPLTGVSAIGDFANRLTQANTWIRVGEFLAGMVLVVIALNAMTKGPARSAATSTAAKGASLAKLVAK